MLPLLRRGACVLCVAEYSNCRVAALALLQTVAEAEPVVDVAPTPTVQEVEATFEKVHAAAGVGVRGRPGGSEAGEGAGAP